MPPASSTLVAEVISDPTTSYVTAPTPKKMSKAQLAQQKQKKQQKEDKELGVSMFQSFDPSFDKQATRAKAINARAAEGGKK